MEKAESSSPAAKKASPKRNEFTGFTPAETDQALLLTKFRVGRRAWARLAILLVFLVASIAAFLQAPRPWQEVFEPKAGMSGLLDDLYYPTERNPHLRLPSVPVNIKAVSFLKDGRIGWIAGDSGYIAKTTDGGLTWERQKIGEAPIRQADALVWPGLIGEAHAAEAPIQQIVPEQKAIRETKPAPAKSTPRAKAESKPVAKPSPLTPPVEAPIDPRNVNLSSIAFADAQHGVAVGSGGTILRSEDGGKTWTVATSDAQALLTSVYLADALHGVAVGSGGTILRSEDGGKTWTAAVSGTRAPLASVYLADTLHGVAVGDGGTILLTEDGGKSWTAVASGTRASLYSVHLADALHGVVVGDGGTILRSEDGGKTWTAAVSGTQAPLTSVYLADTLYGVAVGVGGTILRSEDGGKTWTVAVSATQEWLASVRLADKEHGVAVGFGGTILRTDDGGKTWSAAASGSQMILTAVHLADALHGVAVGLGTVLRTEDGGKSWSAAANGTQGPLYSVYLTDAQHGVAVGKGTILHTENSGKTWSIAASDSQSWLLSVYMVDVQHGVAAGFGGTVLRTEDAGKTWTAVASGSRAKLYSVYLTDALYGVVVGDGGAILLTEDGGKTWTAAASDSRAEFYSVYLADALYGVVVGDGGTILRTEDGGKTWSVATSGTESPLSSVHLAGAQQGVAVGDHGAILRSEDGGKTWTAVASGVQAHLLSVHLADSKHGVAVGFGGTLLRTEDGGKTWVAAVYSRLPAPWYWLTSLVLLGLLWPAGRLREAEIRVEAPRRTVADEYVSDRPARSAAEDRLDFSPRVDGLSRYLRNEHTEPPLTIAVNGAWGSGKSSYMRMLQADLERHGARSVWFNAWHHQKEEHLHAALLEAVRGEAVPNWFSRDGWLFRWRLFWRRAHETPVLALLGVAILVGLAVYLPSASRNSGQTHAERLWQTVGCLVDPPSVASDSDQLAESVDRMSRAVERMSAKSNVTSPDPSTPATKSKRGSECETLLGLAPKTGWLEATGHLLMRGDVGTALFFLLLGLWPLTKGLLALRAFGVDPAILKATLSGLSSRRALSQQTGFRQRFAREFGNVSEALRPAVFTIFIDDLDRCNEQQVMEVLEAVNYLVEAGRCYVVLGMVEETVQRLVGLAFEKVAAELAEQRQDGDPAHAEERKRAQRKHFASHYLEKLINLKVDVPVLDAGHAAGLVARAGEAEPVKDGNIELPRWVGWLDRTIVWPCRAWLPLTILTVAGLSAWLALELAGSGQPTTATPAELVTAPPPEAGGTPKLPIRPVHPPEQPNEPRQRSVALPDRLAPAPAHPGWTIGAGAGGIGLAMLAAMLLALARRLEYHTKDSPAFAQAFRIWTPLLLAGLKTPRGMKRFQNRVRFLAMALDAQARPEPRPPETIGPLGRWLAGREAARREAQTRYNELLPEPVLIGLSALLSLDPTYLDALDGLHWDAVFGDHDKAPPWAHAIDPVLARHRQAVEDGTWSTECAWPPTPEMVNRFKAVVGLATTPMALSEPNRETQVSAA